jgi:hypothetical protein
MDVGYIAMDVGYIAMAVAGREMRATVKGDRGDSLADAASMVAASGHL